MVSEALLIENPFPGPQPYRAADRGRFYGRDDLAYKLEGTVLANRCLTVYGPSGAGKSSLVQASVLPSLLDAHDIRVVKVDGWPDGVEPVSWLAMAVYSDLGFGVPPEGMESADAIFMAAKRVARGSSRPLVVYLDQMEQLLYSNRKPDESEALFECVHQLVELPLRNIRVVLSLREDYLGRFRDRLKDRRRILDHGFRVGPLTVLELTEAVCQAAASGKPSQQWDAARIKRLMMQVRVAGQAQSDDAEAQSAYAQIVCRALFQMGASGDSSGVNSQGEIRAEPIVYRYVEMALAALGERRGAAQRLLEEHMITADGGRTLRTENELLKVLPAEDLLPILKGLEGSAILHAEEHQGSRYFELGHDWLAKKVLEERQARELLEEQRRREEAQREELERQRAEALARQEKERAERRRLRVITALSLGVAALTGGLGFWAWSERNVAREQTKIALEKTRIAQEQTDIANEQTVEALDARIMAVFRDIRGRGDLAWGMKFLAEVSHPDKRRGWVEMASDALAENTLRATLLGARGPLSGAVFSPNGKLVLTASSDWKARLYDASGRGDPVVLAGHGGSIRDAVFSADGSYVLTSSDDGTARVWETRNPERSIVLKGHEASVNSASFSPDGKQVATASDDGQVRVWNTGGTGVSLVLKGHESAVNMAIFNASGDRVISVSADKTVRIWELNSKAKPKVLKGHEGEIRFIALSPDGKRLVTASADRSARIWNADGSGKTIELRHLGEVNHAAWSADGQRIATASADGLVRVWKADGKGDPLVLKGHTGAVNHVVFAPNGHMLASASDDESVRVWDSDGVGEGIAMLGHHAPVETVAFRGDGGQLVSASADYTRGALNFNTAKIWEIGNLQIAVPHAEGMGVTHSAFLGEDGNSVLSVLDDNSAMLWQLGSRKAPVFLKGHEGWVTSGALSPDSKRVVTGSFDKTLRIWGVDGKEEAVLKGHTGEIRSVVFSPDGSKIASVADDKTARVWNADGTGEARTFSGHQQWVSSVAFSVDGKKIITTSFDRTARIWNADGSGDPIVLSGHTADVRAAAFSPDGRRVVTGSKDKTLMIWNADGTGKPTVLRGHKAAVTQVVWSRDGAYIVSASQDQTVIIWPAGGGGEPIVLSSGILATHLVFQDGGKRVMLIGAGNRMRSFRLDVNTLVKELSQATVDCVPAGIRAVYLGESEEKARENFAACEGLHGRKASLKPPDSQAVDPILGDPNAGVKMAKILVLPGDATVEVDGIVAHRHAGFIDLGGKVGEKRMVRVLKGEEQREWEVSILDTEASPSILNLSAPLPGKKGDGGKKEGPTLVPEEFQ